jgi:hypothetical protein
MMKHVMRAALVAVFSAILALGASAQAKSAQPATKPASSEKTVEEAYLQASAESMMIKALTRMDDLDSKQEALKRARKAIDDGHKNDDIRNALSYLALENTSVIVKSAGLGASTNNFPMVRKEACKYLGEFPSVETKDTLVTVILNSRTEDPMVLAEAILSLGQVGLNDNDEVTDAIVYSVNHFAKVGMAEDRLAEYTMAAILKLAEKPGIKDYPSVTDMLMRFTKGAYTLQVKNDVMKTLDKLAQFQSKSNSAKK